MRIKQLSVFLENKAGQLARVTRVLGDNGINIRALSLADTSDFGIIRLIVNDVEKAQSALRASGFICLVNDVTPVEAEDEPGGLARVLEALEGRGINVEYMYAYSEANRGNAALIFRFDDPDTAVQCLQEAGISLLSDFDLGSGGLRRACRPEPSATGTPKTIPPPRQPSLAPELGSASVNVYVNRTT